MELLTEIKDFISKYDITLNGEGGVGGEAAVYEELEKILEQLTARGMELPTVTASSTTSNASANVEIDTPIAKHSKYKDEDVVLLMQLKGAIHRDTCSLEALATDRVSEFLESMTHPYVQYL